MFRIKFILISIIFVLIISGFCYSQFVTFGRNKVQYSEFDWYVLSTEHTKLYFYKQAKELAEQGAYIAEESYKELQQKFNYSLLDTVPIIIYSSPAHFQQTNTTPGFIPEGVGGFFEFIKGRVVVPFDGSLGNFKHVMTHELVHVFMTSMIANVQKIHGQNDERQPPLWFTEGLAELWSTDWDTQSEMVLKDAVLNNYIVGINDYESIYGSYLMYKLGQRVLMFIQDKFGKEKILQLIENFWMDDNFSNVLKATIGLDYEEFDKKFLYYLKKEYYLVIENSDNPSNTSINLFSSGFAHKPSYFKGNKTEEIFYIGNNYGYTSIFKKKLSIYDKPELVIEGESTEKYEQFHFFRTGLDINKKGILAFVTQMGETDVLHLYDLYEDNEITYYSFKDIVGIGAPSWSKDGKKITFAGIESSGKNDLYVFDITKNKLNRLTNDYYDDRDPDFSPDGKYIVFSSDRTSFGKNNKYNLFLYNLENNQINYLTAGEQEDFSPRFSDNGKMISFTSTALTGIQNIWIIDISNLPENNSTTSSGDSTADTLPEMKMITSFTTGAYDPQWAGDNRIIFSAYENNNITIHLLEDIKNKIINPVNKLKIDYNIIGNIWTTNKIISEPKKNELKYKKKFSLDIATTVISTDPVFGTNSGGVISLSDMLGNEKYYILIYNTSNANTEFWKSFNIAVSKVLLEKRLNHAYGIYHLSGKRYDLTESDYSYFERVYGAYLSLSYPLSFFRRIETSINLSQSIKDIDLFNNRRSLLLSNSISYVFDNTLWHYTGPVDGTRYNITLGHTVDIQNSNENYFSFLFDIRKYFRLSRPLTLAFRGEFFINEGKYPRRFFMGGTWSLRGWSWYSIRGTKMWLFNAEFRFPLINTLMMRFPFDINMNFPGIRGALYFDAGNAWDTKENYKSTKGSIGAGVRMNLFGAIVLRYDMGKRIEDNFKKLQEGLYHQFFFGWDF